MQLHFFLKRVILWLDYKCKLKEDDYLATLPQHTITESEWEIMRVIWAHKTLTSKEIIDYMQAISDWKPGTIKTLIHRLQTKERIAPMPNHQPNSYIALITEHDAMVSVIQSMLERTCVRDRASLISAVMDRNALSQTDCQKLIDQLNHRLPDAPSKLTCSCLPGQCHCQQHHKEDLR